MFNDRFLNWNPLEIIFLFGVSRRSVEILFIEIAIRLLCSRSKYWICIAIQKIPKPNQARMIWSCRRLRQNFQTISWNYTRWFTKSTKNIVGLTEVSTHIEEATSISTKWFGVTCRILSWKCNSSEGLQWEKLSSRYLFFVSFFSDSSSLNMAKREENTHTH